MIPPLFVPRKIVESAERDASTTSLYWCGVPPRMVRSFKVSHESGFVRLQPAVGLNGVRAGCWKVLT